MEPPWRRPRAIGPIPGCTPPTPDPGREVRNMRGTPRAGSHRTGHVLRDMRGGAGVWTDINVRGCERRGTDVKRGARMWTDVYGCEMRLHGCQQMQVLARTRWLWQLLLWVMGLYTWGGQRGVSASFTY